MKRLNSTIALLIILLVNSNFVSAQMEISHFAPGVYGIRDFIMPEPGYYGALYSYKYSTERLNNASGDEIKSVTINPGPGLGVTLGVNVNVDVGVLAPTFIWASKWKLLGARYGAYIAPALSNTSVGASLSTYTGSGRSSDDSQFNFGDLYVQPVWLNWSIKQVDFSLSYGFTAPVGKYDTETIALPIVGPVTVEAADNIGFGFWTHQFQGAASWYPWVDKRMAVAIAMTYEINGKKKDFDLTPGQNFTFNWGVSEYLPLRKDQTLLLEIGPAGYSSFQTTEDTGSDTSNTAKDQVQAVGFQVGLTHVKWNAVLNFHYFNEFESKDRFQGESIGLNFAIKF
jgi:hypothetical protein